MANLRQKIEVLRSTWAAAYQEVEDRSRVYRDAYALEIERTAWDRLMAARMKQNPLYG